LHLVVKYLRVHAELDTTGPDKNQIRSGVGGNGSCSRPHGELVETVSIQKI